MVYRRADLLIVLSAAFKQLLVEQYKIRPHKIAVIPPGVDLVRFSPGSKTAARANLDLPESTFLALAVRRLTPRMGLDVLLRAWRRVTIEPKLLLLAGSGPDQSRLEEIALRSDLGRSIRFLGQVSDDALAGGVRGLRVVSPGIPGLWDSSFGK